MSTVLEGCISSRADSRAGDKHLLQLSTEPHRNQGLYTLQVWQDLRLRQPLKTLLRTSATSSSLLLDKLFGTITYILYLQHHWDSTMAASLLSIVACSILLSVLLQNGTFSTSYYFIIGVIIWLVILMLVWLFFACTFRLICCHSGQHQYKLKKWLLSLASQYWTSSISVGFMCRTCVTEYMYRV